MQIKSLGHVVVRVRDLARSEAFYRDTLGMPVCAHYNQDGLNMAFFSLGNHHDFAIMEHPDLGEETASGLDHVAFKIGETMEDLVDAKQRMDELGIETDPIDHDVTKSLYISDPDGNGIELYIDYSDGWKTNPNRLVDTLKPLAL